MAYFNHLKYSNDYKIHKDKKIRTTFNSLDYESYIQSLDLIKFDLGRIPAGYEHRADLISNLFYGTPTLDWVICLVNKINDPFQQLNVGDPIKIPKIL